MTTGVNEETCRGECGIRQQEEPVEEPAGLVRCSQLRQVRRMAVRPRARGALVVCEPVFAGVRAGGQALEVDRGGRQQQLDLQLGGAAAARPATQRLGFSSAMTSGSTDDPCPRPLPGHDPRIHCHGALLACSPSTERCSACFNRVL